MFLLARVAKWQTRWLQVPVFERTWGFKSPLAHQLGTLNCLTNSLQDDWQVRVASAEIEVTSRHQFSMVHNYERGLREVLV